VGHPKVGGNPSSHAGTVPTPARVPTAEELGIPLPTPTIRPLFVALFLTLMFASMLLIHEGKTPLAIVFVIAFAAAMVATLYSWLLTPLEEHVEHAH
jgi:hypothetical protein